MVVYVLAYVACCCAFVRAVDLERVLNFLNEYDAEIYTRDIILTPEDEKTLTKET